MPAANDTLLINMVRASVLRSQSYGTEAPVLPPPRVLSSLLGLLGPRVDNLGFSFLLAGGPSENLAILQRHVAAMPTELESEVCLRTV